MPNAAPLPPLEEIESLFRYNSETGEMFWNKTGKGINKDGRAGCIDNRGYVQVRINGQRCYVHRLAWFLTHKKMPDGEIDHINGNPADNRIANLRVATHNQNCRNSRTRSDNKTGFKGVTFHEGKFRAAIKRNGRLVHLGCFRSAEEAYAAYCRAATKSFGEFARLS